MAKLYSNEFYDSAQAQSLSSAKIILGLLWKRYKPTSVLDVGCGNGCWLDAAAQLGASQLTGIEGDWMTSDRLANPTIRLITKNLEMPVNFESRFDLAISVEVAEHLNVSAADRFVGQLCAASDIVLFSAAIPHQGGTHHINEQPQSYWSQLFAKHGYRPHDLFRPVIWDNPMVAYWYRQNTLLYVRADAELAFELPANSETAILDLVHPEILHFYAMVVQRVQVNPTVWTALRLLAKSLINLVKR